MPFMQTDLYTFGLLPLLIFCSRVADVSVGTIRIVFVSRGNKVIAPLLGFVEVLIWLLAIGNIMQNLDNPPAYLAFAGGFAMGNFVGLWIEQRLAVGLLAMRIITRTRASALIEALRERGFRVVSVKGHGNVGPVDVLYTIFPRACLRLIVDMVRERNPAAFYSIEEIKSVSDNITLPVVPLAAARRRGFPGPLRMLRKGK